MTAVHNRILLVDDEPDIRLLLKDALQEEGYVIDTACDGREGIEKIQSVLPDLIILDMNMPRMNGLEVYHRLYDSEKKRSRFPVLAVTARGDLEDLFKELNVEGYITKPFRVEELIEEVAVIFRKRYGAVPGEKAAPAPAKKTPEHPRTHRILLVEANTGVFNDVITLFQNYGYELLAAERGGKAMQMLMTRYVDLVLIHEQLPDISGDLMVYKLRQMSRTVDLPVILYCESDKAETIRQICEQIGVSVPRISHSKIELFRHCDEVLTEFKTR